MKDIVGKMRNAAASLIDEVEKLKDIKVSKASLKKKISYGKSKTQRYKSESSPEGQD